MHGNGPVFPGSYALTSLHSFVAPELVAPVIRTVIRRAPATAVEEVVAYLAARTRRSQLVALHQTSSLSVALDGGAPQEAAEAMADSMGVAALASLIDNPFKADKGLPSAFQRIFYWGGERLYSYGREQAQQLVGLFRLLIAWLEKRGLTEVYVLESPLGATVPCAVFCRLLETRGLSGERVELLTPRLKNSDELYSIRKAVERVCASRLTRNIPVVFIDEMITGSRFTKLYSELSQQIPADRLVPIAMEVHDQTRIAHPVHESQREGLRSRLRKSWAGREGAPVHLVFPTVPLVKIDSGAPVTLNAPFFWAEKDLSAGRRKVNYVFGLFNQLKAFGVALRDKDSQEMEAVRVMWRQSVNGEEWVDPNGLTESILVRCAEQFDWDELERKAREQFPDEYEGSSDDFSPSAREDFTSRRMRWLLEAIEKDLSPQPSGYGGVFANALHHLFMWNAVIARANAGRDRDYCEYTLAYEPPIRCFHDALVKKIFEAY